MGIIFISRIKQGFSYIFCKYDNTFDKEIKEILSEVEFLIFSKMSDYDKLHSYNLMKRVQKNNLLSNNNLYLKLALLHDCGKGNASLLRRIKKVLMGDKILEMHSLNAYEKLKKYNLELATLCLNHHNKPLDEMMREFQKLDDE
ncbi:MAG: HD domain-containing protein [Fusobacterium sp.]|uniref:HD domain-containing protein n=1 Tax=Fusobacterium sp. TaxID=68766 RepID=UPI0026DA7BFB|nr:HD domain-containing protein [Fusobacterium sp.]MDO4690112.1 HD domain-containing protein [Fusobacterium sp.]